MRQSLRTLAYPLCVDAGVANDGGSGSNVWLLGLSRLGKVSLPKPSFSGPH